ncbi:MAG: T9SS type A sorting domain-containing protein [Ignavibacteria bacterium]|nr:T9SS type A sorting domain-containing protein [Ignavibacteria bacterium]
MNIILTLLVILTLPSIMFAQLGNPNGIQINILNTTPTSTTIEFILNDYNEVSIDVNGSETMFYSIPGNVWLMEKGMPQLPIHRSSIIIPDLAAMNFNIISEEYTEIGTLPVMPSKGHITRDIDPSTIPFAFSNFYSINNWYPAETILIDEPYIVKDLRGATVQFNPMKYNPVEGKLKICTRLVVEVYDDPNQQVVNPLIRNFPLIGTSMEFDGIYKNLFINYGTGYYDYVTVNEQGRLLVIYASEYSNNITPFVNWKVQRGLTTITAEYPTATGNDANSIKDYIQNLYDSPEGLAFIILVGESNQVPTLYGQYEGAPSDPSYTKLSGSDAYPDAFISRISPSSSDNLDYILWKLINYEENPDVGPEAAWYHKGTGVASNEGNPRDWERANWLRDMLLNNMSFTQVDQIYDPGATSLQVTTALNEGRSVINYLGHGSGTSWGTTGFNVSKIHNLSNGTKNPLVIDVSCTNGNFELGECMEEAWIRAGDMNDPKGAIASFGASTLASWVPPCDMQNHSTMLLTTEQMQTVGGVLFNGIMHAMDLWGGSSGQGLKLMEQYNIMGDCTTILAFDVAVPVELTAFSIENVNDEVIIKWQTATESNNSGFEVQKSQKSKIKSQTDWLTVSFVEGNGTTTEVNEYIYRDKIEKPGSYYYRLKQIDFEGTTTYSPEIEVDVTGPTEFVLMQNYPNPFNPATTIRFTLPVKTDMVIAVYNSIGEKVAEAFRGEMEEGYHEVKFDGSNLPAGRQGLSSGVYFYRFESNQFIDVKKMVLSK